MAAFSVVSWKHGTQDVCMMNKVCKYHIMCKTVDTSQELKKVIIEIYCIKKYLLDLDPI